MLIGYCCPPAIEAAAWEQYARRQAAGEDTTTMGLPRHAWGSFRPDLGRPFRPDLGFSLCLDGDGRGRTGTLCRFLSHTKFVSKSAASFLASFDSC